MKTFLVTRTLENNQLGLTALIESVNMGETKAFIEAAPVLKLLREMGEDLKWYRRIYAYKHEDDLPDNSVGAKSLEKLNTFLESIDKGDGK